MPASRISVIIPNFNREALIGETVSNLLDQTLPPSEIIVVDDGSTDKSVDVIHAFGDKVELIRQANQGPGAARNAGLKIATGEFIQFQDSDDFVPQQVGKRRPDCWSKPGRTLPSARG